jgi:hypothetical protein
MTAPAWACFHRKVKGGDSGASKLTGIPVLAVVPTKVGLTNARTG